MKRIVFILALFGSLTSTAQKIDSAKKVEIKFKHGGGGLNPICIISIPKKFTSDTSASLTEFLKPKIIMTKDGNDLEVIGYSMNIGSNGVFTKLHATGKYLYEIDSLLKHPKDSIIIEDIQYKDGGEVRTSPAIITLTAK